VSFQFPPRREDDDLGPPPPPFRIRPSRPEFRSFGNYNRWIILGVSAVLLYIILNTLKSIYVDYLWFDGVGYRSVFTKVITTQAILFLGGAGVFLAYFGGNLLLAARPVLRTPAPGLDESEAASLRRFYLLAIIAGSIFLSLIFGTIMATNWDTVLVFLEGESFGIRDPQFNRDIGFYVFSLPALQFFYGWAMGVAVITTLVVAGLYFFRFIMLGSDDRVARFSRVHLSLLLLAIVALFIWHYWLERFELNFSTAGAVFGATYTDIHARLPFIYVGMALAVVTGVALVASALGRSVVIPMGAAALWAGVSTVGGGLYPASVQRFSVQPNELQRERPYIERNIQATRAAFGLDEVDERPFPAALEVTREEIDAHPETINNIRLLDVRPLLQTYIQIQTIRPLYEFLDVDVDRYVINGVRRQVMLSARELNVDRLPAEAQSWVNRRLQFTHGYGLVMSPVNEVIQEGLPQLFLRNIPVTGVLPVTRPEIYYGEEPDHYVIVKTKDEEFDYPIEGGAATTVFEGEGGAKVGSLLNRLVFAWELGDINILISDSLTSESRILFRRNIQQRVEAIAPFLRLDRDPYLVVSEGRLFWFQDAYTTTDRYPYSEPSGGINYIRNSVKIVIDAYDGSTTFYLIDDEDPIIRTYAKIFPDMFTPFAEMPDALQEHIRYPEDLFQVQINKYLLYHLTDPVARYNQEDRWTIPTEVVGQDTDVPVQPYYIISRIPGEPREEFMLIMPLTPARRQNTIAWMAARSDGDNYGRLLAFQFPTDSLVYGPRLIASQFALWRQSGSDIIRGNLLMIPIGQGNLFVEPVYLQARQGQLPELKRVIVVNGNRIAMEPTLDQSLAVIFGERAPTLPTTEDVPTGVAPSPTPSPAVSPTPAVTPVPPLPTPTPGAPAPAGSAAELARQAEAAFRRAQQALQRGDFAAYGQEIAEAQRLVEQLVQVTGSP
jgi:uncharacterized membrane protein (UPF0182 family)